jgi:hypothetical protein
MKFKDLKESLKTIHEDFNLEQLAERLDVPHIWYMEDTANQITLDLEAANSLPVQIIVTKKGTEFAINYIEGYYTHQPRFPFEEIYDSIYFEDDKLLSFEEAVAFLNETMQKVDGFNYLKIKQEEVRTAILDCLEMLKSDLDDAISDINKHGNNIHTMFEYFLIGIQDTRHNLNSDYVNELINTIK